MINASLDAQYKVKEKYHVQSQPASHQPPVVEGIVVDVPGVVYIPSVAIQG